MAVEEVSHSIFPNLLKVSYVVALCGKHNLRANLQERKFIAPFY